MASLTLAYVFSADAPHRLPESTADWFREFPTRQEDSIEELASYVDNTYFFSRSCREYLFPEIVALEDDILRTEPSVLREDVLFETVRTTAEVSASIAKRWMETRNSRVVPESRRLRRYLVRRINGVERPTNGWSLVGSIDRGNEESYWERRVDSVEFRIMDAEVQLYEGNVGVAVLTIGVREDDSENREFLKNLSAVTKDVLPPNTDFPVAKLRFEDGTSQETEWLQIMSEMTEPFRHGPTPNSRSLFTPKNQEFGQYFRRFWYLPSQDMEDAYDIVRINYLQPFPTDRKRPLPAGVFNLDEGWRGLVHHHEFVISGQRECLTNGDETKGWYETVLRSVVMGDYSWLWILAVVQRVRLGRLLANLDVSAPSNAEAELQEFYDFMQQENFAFPSTQAVGNQLARELSKATDVNELIQQIEREAGVIRESVLARSARSQSAALALIALLGTWLSLGELADSEGNWNAGWFAQPYTWLALAGVTAVYWLSRIWLLRKTRRRIRRSAIFGVRWYRRNLMRLGKSRVRRSGKSP